MSGRGLPARASREGRAGRGMAGVPGPDAASLRRSGGRVSDATREETKLELLGRKGIAFAVAVLVGCGSASSRGVRVEFFPGPIDRELQAASRDAVVRVLERHGARVVRSRPSSV